MPNFIPEISGGAVVLVGSFNPQIFQPAWFAQQGLLPQAEVDTAEIKLIHPQVSNFETERFMISVTNDRLQVNSRPNSSSAPVKDLVLGAFFLLEHTPVIALGLNYGMHFAMPTMEKWHEVGNRLAPKEPWAQVLEGRPGMLSLTIQTSKEKPKGAEFRVRVEPSTAVRPYGVYFETNEHYPAPEVEPLTGLMDILSNRWEEAQTYASKIVDHILQWTSTDK